MLTDSSGNRYTLRGPNPIMSGQEVWDKATTYNLDNYEEISYVPKSWKFKSDEKNIITSNLSPPSKIILNTESERVKCWVLPTELKVTIDPVYGDQSKRMVWGSKFSMEISFENVGDVYAVFWTNAIKSINSGSIIYTEMRHWKVSSYENSQDGNGIFIKCSITDQSPSFG